MGCNAARWPKREKNQGAMSSGRGGDRRKEDLPVLAVGMNNDRRKLWELPEFVRLDDRFVNRPIGHRAPPSVI